MVNISYTPISIENFVNGLRIPLTKPFYNFSIDEMREYLRDDLKSWFSGYLVIKKRTKQK